MKFYGREAELDELATIRRFSFESSRFTVVTGRRRVGKTELVEKAFRDGKTPYLYLLISQRAEKDLCVILQEDISRVLSRPLLGQAERFGQLFRAVLEYSIETPLTLVIDEFQEFDRIDPAIFTDIQGVWDELHRKARVNLVVCGSVNRLMNKIFFDDSQPLYGRNTGKIHLDPFPVDLVKTILAEHAPKYTPRDLLALWTMTGGVARYVELLMDAKATTRKKMIETVFGLSSAYVDEGRVILGQEFGRESGVYFSILSAIASGRTSYAEIRNVIGAEIGGQLTKLETVYSLIEKVQPAYETPTSRNCQYRINDCFFRFWFRFVYKYLHLLEQKQYAELCTLVERDLDQFSGFALERYFRAKFLEAHRYTRVAGWWDRKGENEIDLVCENEVADTLDFFEVKCDQTRLRQLDLQLKVAAFFRKHPDLQRDNVRIDGLSLADM